MMLLGFSGFGDAASDCNANPNTEWDGTSCVQFQSSESLCNANPTTYWDTASQSCAAITSAGASSAQAAAAAAQQQSSGSWWQGAITALTKGVVQGSTSPAIVPCISPGVPAGCVTLPVVTPPWYTTPIGMLGIALTLGVGYVVLKK